MEEQVEKHYQSINRIIEKFYGIFRVSDGKKPDLEELRSLCLPHITITNLEKGALTQFDLTSFIQPRQKLFDEHAITELLEEEISESTAVQGNIAQRLSRYYKKGFWDGVEFEGKGTKSIQLLNTLQGWKIASIVWEDDEEKQVVH